MPFSGHDTDEFQVALQHQNLQLKFLADSFWEQHYVDCLKEKRKQTEKLRGLAQFSRSFFRSCMNCSWRISIPQGIWVGAIQCLAAQVRQQRWEEHQQECFTMGKVMLWISVTNSFTVCQVSSPAWILLFHCLLGLNSRKLALWFYLQSTDLENDILSFAQLLPSSIVQGYWWKEHCHLLPFNQSSLYSCLAVGSTVISTVLKSMDLQFCCCY